MDLSDSTIAAGDDALARAATSLPTYAGFIYHMLGAITKEETSTLERIPAGLRRGTAGRGAARQIGAGRRGALRGGEMRCVWAGGKGLTLHDRPTPRQVPSAQAAA